MTPITTLRAQLPCPTCGVVGPLTLAVRAGSESTELVEAGPRQGLPGGTHVGLLSECSACWARRADRIGQARTRLVLSGELSSLGPGQEDAWLGVPLSRCEEAFESAFGSALMKTGEGEPVPAAPLEQLFEIETDDETETTPEPELVRA